MVRAMGSSSASRIFMLQAALDEFRRVLGRPPSSRSAGNNGTAAKQLKSWKLDGLNPRNDDGFPRRAGPWLLGSGHPRAARASSTPAVLDDHRLVWAGVGVFALELRARARPPFRASSSQERRAPGERLHGA